MATLQIGNGNWATEEDYLLGYNINDYDRKYYPRDIAWTRGSDAWSTNSSGLIQRAPWNLLTYSEDFSNAIWSKGNTTVTTNSITAPNGTLTADTLTDNSTNSTHTVDIGGILGVITFSVYAKKGTSNFVGLYSSSALQGVYWNLDTGAFSSNINAAPTSSSITSVGDGWYRCSITVTGTSTATLRILMSNNGSSFIYAGTGQTIYIWGAQLVEGSAALDYFPTTDRLNVGRVDYTYTSRGAMLVEPQRTNLALYSEQFDNSVWAQGGPTTVTANTTTSPDGTTNADTATFNSTTAYLREAIFSSLTNGSTYTLSIYAKASASSGASNVRLTVNNTTTWTGAASTKVALTSSWQRITLTWTANGAAAYFIIGATDVTGANDSTCYGNVDLYGAQLEAGAYPTTYIPTTTASATRIADSFSRNNIYTNGLITSSGGTWFVELVNNIPYTRDNSSANLFLNSDITAFVGNGFYIRNTGGGNTRLTIAVYVSGSATASYTTTTNTTKIAIKWNGTTADVFVNGTKQLSAVSFTATALEHLQAPVQLPNYIPWMTLYSTPLSDAECAFITTL